MPDILIVDDELPIRNLIKAILKMQNVNCSFASNAAAAREIIGKQKFDLLISDIDMPGESGLALSQFVLSKYSDTAVIIMTGLEDSKLVKYALEIGAYSYLAKPIEKNTLLFSVNSALKRAALESENRKYRENLESLVVERTTNLQQTNNKLQDTQRTLKRSEAKYRSIFETSKDAICITTTEGQFVDINTAAAELFGYSKEEFLTINHKDLYVNASDRRKLVEFISEQGQLDDFFVDLKKKNGTVINALIGTSAWSDKESGLQGYQGIIRDITEKLRAEKMLRENEKKYRELVQSANSIIIRIDTLGKIKFFNEFALNFFGYSEDEILNQPAVGTFIPAQASSGFDPKQLINEIIRNPAEYKTNENENMRKNGDRVWIAWTNKVIYDNAGNASEILCIGNNVSEQKLAILALKESEEKFKAIGASAQEAIIIMNHQGFISYWNAAAEKIFGYAVKEALNMDLHRLIVPARYFEAFKKGFKNYQKTGRGSAVGKIIEVTAQRKDKTEFPIELSISAMELNGQWNALGIVRDISERKLAEDTLREIEERYKGLFERSFDLVYLFDLEGNFIDANQTALKHLGYTRDVIQSMNFSELLDEAQVPRADEAVEEILQTGSQKHAVEFKLRTRDGEHIYVESKGALVKKDNKPFAIQGIARDITVRRLAMDDLKQSERRFRELIEGSIQGILIHRNHKPVFVNQTWAAIHGYTVEEILRMESIVPLISPDDQVRMVEYKQARLRGEDAPDNYEYQGIRKDGSLIWLENRVMPVCWDGETAIQTIIVDISDRKVLETQLVHAQKLESIGQLAAGIAHEINTPIQYVAYNTQFFKEQFEQLAPLLDSYPVLFQAAKTGKVSADLLSDAESIIKDVDLAFIKEEIPPAIDQSLEGVERVSEIVRAMKEFSHPGSEDKTPTDINRAIESTITVARNEWKYAAEVTTDLDADLPLVPCLPADFNQVILNMIVNAAHAIGEAVGDGSEKGRITIQTSRDNGWAQIRITDTGTGIAAEHHSRIFDPFFTTKEVGKGTGQGLAISHSIIADKHGGTLNFETEIGQGTTFIIRLPIEQDLK